MHLKVFVCAIVSSSELSPPVTKYTVCTVLGTYVGRWGMLETIDFSLCMLPNSEPTTYTIACPPQDKNLEGKGPPTDKQLLQFLFAGYF